LRESGAREWASVLQVLVPSGPPGPAPFAASVRPEELPSSVAAPSRARSWVTGSRRGADCWPELARLLLRWPQPSIEAAAGPLARGGADGCRRAALPSDRAAQARRGHSDRPSRPSAAPAPSSRQERHRQSPAPARHGPAVGSIRSGTRAARQPRPGTSGTGGSATSSGSSSPFHPVGISRAIVGARG